MSRYIKMNQLKIKQLRQERGLSQERASWECLNQGLRISEATIKRAEAGRKIMYRTAYDFAQFFQKPLMELIDDVSFGRH